jgi:hypothetical protein
VICFEFLYSFCLKHFSFSEEMSEVWPKMCIGLHVKYPLFLSDFNETWIFPNRFSNSTQISNFMKIHWVGAELFHAGRRTDGRTEGRTDERTNVTKLIVAFRNFANAPNNRLFGLSRYLTITLSHNLYLKHGSPGLTWLVTVATMCDSLYLLLSHLTTWRVSQKVGDKRSKPSAML